MGKEEKCIIIVFILSLIGMIAYGFMVFYHNSRIKRIEVSGLEKNDIVYYFDDIAVDEAGDKCKITGWAYKKGENMGYFDTAVILKNIETNHYYKINTKFVKRVDVSSFVNDGFNYDNSGFFGRFSLSKIKERGKYQICLIYLNTNNNILCETDQYLTIFD